MLLLEDLGFMSLELYIAIPDLVRYVFKAACFGRKDLGVPHLSCLENAIFFKDASTPGGEVKSH